MLIIVPLFRCMLIIPTCSSMHSYVSTFIKRFHFFPVFCCGSNLRRKKKRQISKMICSFFKVPLHLHYSIENLNRKLQKGKSWRCIQWGKGWEKMRFFLGQKWLKESHGILSRCNIQLLFFHSYNSFGSKFKKNSPSFFKILKVFL